METDPALPVDNKAAEKERKEAEKRAKKEDEQRKKDDEKRRKDEEKRQKDQEKQAKKLEEQRLKEEKKTATPRKAAQPSQGVRPSRMVLCRVLLLDGTDYEVEVEVCVCPVITSNPANTKYLYNICIMLDQRRRRLADVVQMLCKCFCVLGNNNVVL